MKKVLTLFLTWFALTSPVLAGGMAVEPHQVTRSVSQAAAVYQITILEPHTLYYSDDERQQESTLVDALKWFQASDPKTPAVQQDSRTQLLRSTTYHYAPWVSIKKVLAGNPETPEEFRLVWTDYANALCPLLGKPLLPEQSFTLVIKQWPAGDSNPTPEQLTKHDFILVDHTNVELQTSIEAGLAARD